MAEDMERVEFDFSDGALEDTLNKLESMLSSGHWSSRGINWEDKQTAGLFLWLLQSGGITVYKRPYRRRDDPSPELRDRAAQLSMLMHKQFPSQTLIDIADIFSDYEYEPGRLEFNSLFFPKLKAFVRCGGIPADRLMGLLEWDGCDMVLLFPDFHGENFFYAFCRAMPREEYLNAIRDMEDERLAEVSDRLRRMERSGMYAQVPNIPTDD